MSKPLTRRLSRNNNGILLSYPFYWLSITNDSFENDEYIEVQYDIFPEILSDNVIINSIEVSSKEMTESSYSLVDKEKGIIFIVQSIKNETVITKAIKFNDPSKLQNINITFAYYDIDQHHMVIFTDKNVDYLIRIDNFEQEDKRVNGNWETASGYYSDYDKSYILSQINYSERKTRIISLSTQEVIAEMELNDSLVKGDILKYKNSKLLVKSEEGTSIFVINNRIGSIICKKSYKDGKKFGNIEDFWAFDKNAKEMYIALFDKNMNYPVSLINAIDSDWELIQSPYQP